MEPAAVSATNRSNVRRPDDFYATPAWCVRAALSQLFPIKSPEAVLDPCCGDGAILSAVVDYWAETKTVSDWLYGIELDPVRAAIAEDKLFIVEARDALTPVPWPKKKVIITNPPYGNAMMFVERALDEVAEGGTVVMLLRLNWLGSQKRAAFHREHPSDVFVLPRRPGFTEDGKTDATEYAWFAWGPGRGNRWYVLDCEARER